MITTRAESADDIPAARRVNELAFGRPDEVFMVAELKPGALGGRRGLVKYRPEFGGV